MTEAIWILLTPPVDLGTQGKPLAVVAHQGGAFYLDATGNSPDGLGASRAANIADLLGVAPTSARDWLGVALSNIGLWDQGPVIEAQDVETARAQAAQAARDWRPPPRHQTRQERMFREARIMAEWAQEYPKAAAGDADDPDADLALAQMLLPPVDSTSPHTWMPLGVGDTACAFCGQDQDGPLHQVGPGRE